MLDALKTLSAEGVVKLTLHRGAFIRALSRKTLTICQSSSKCLCGVAARLAAERIGHGDDLKQSKAAQQAIAGLRNGTGVSGFAEERASKSVISHQELATLAIEHDEFHGEWNCRLRPRDPHA